MTAVAETRSEFHARRAKGIGGSDVAAIFGLDRYRTPLQLWEEKTGLVTPSDEITPDQERGIVFEPIAKRLYTERTGRDIVDVQKHGAHPDYPWMLYTLDGIEIVEGAEMPVEVKCPSLGMFSRIKREGLPDSWVLQMQHYLICTGYKAGRYIIFCADRMEFLPPFTVTVDDGLGETLIEKEREFWTLVEMGQPPADVVAEVQGQEIVVVGEVTKRYDDDFATAAKLLRDAKALKKNAEAMEEEAKERLLEVVDNKHGIYEAPGLGRVHYQQREGRTTFDSKALANAKPLDRIAVAAFIVDYFEPVSDVWQDRLTDDCALDLSKFEKKGKPFSELRPYFGRGEE